MINDKSLEAIEAARWNYQGRVLCPPLYDSYCFSNIPATLCKLLGKEGKGLPHDCYTPGSYESVVVILLDGFGWEFLQKNYENYPFLGRFFKEGIVSKLTSQFPSTTAAHITTLCSGQEVGQTSIYEWYIYEPKLGRVIAPLLYSFAGDKEVGSLQKVLPPEALLPSSTLFQQLHAQGVKSTVFQHQSIGDSVYSRWMFQGSNRISYRKFSEGLLALADQVATGGLFYFYFGDIDTECHHRGMDSSNVKKTVESTFVALEQFWQKLVQLKGKTALIVTADHGMTSIDPKTTYFLNREIAEATEWFLHGKDGRPLTPVGSCRDYFLHLRPDKLDMAYQQLQHALKDKALVFSTDELIKKGFFGSRPISASFLKRVGNLVILPDDHQTVWWHEKGKFDQRFYAMHGGLTPHEMETMFLFLNLSQ
jgi:predicted AlkP superfamily pyrophosphatase or phosphodiesterase